MSKLIDKYQTLYNMVIERAIHINNMLYELDLPDQLEHYKPAYCNLDIESVGEMSVDIVVRLVYFVPYEDYNETWEIPTSYIDMEDKDIVEDFIKRITEKCRRETIRNIELLKRDADVLGYELVEKKK